MMRPASTLRGSPSLAPVTAACPRCRGRLVQLEEPTCLPCGWVDYSLQVLTCGICREPLTGDRQRYCSTACVTRAGNSAQGSGRSHAPGPGKRAVLFPLRNPNPAKVLLSRRQVRVGQGAVKTARARSGGIAADGSVVR